MADTLLEQTRGACMALCQPPPPLAAPCAYLLHAALHEDLERLERIIVKDFKQEVRTYKEKLVQNHRVRKRLDAMNTASNKLVCPTFWVSKAHSC